MVGQPANAPAITGRIRGQMLLEAAVARTPRPSAMVSAATDRTVFAAVRCANATTVPTDPGIPEFRKPGHWRHFYLTAPRVRPRTR